MIINILSFVISYSENDDNIHDIELYLYHFDSITKINYFFSSNPMANTFCKYNDRNYEYLSI